MEKKIVLSIDMMGGDNGYVSTVPAVIRALKHYPNLHIIAVGSVDMRLHYERLCKKRGLNNHSNRIIFVTSSHEVAMHDSVPTALRKNSSAMHIAINMVKNNKAHATVSSGNTAALTMMSRSLLGMIGDMHRPAIAKMVKKINGEGFNCILDLGANLQCNEHDLQRFAVIGSGLCSSVQNIENPRVGLLNIGTEDSKGTLITRRADRILRHDERINYIGYVESNMTLGDKVDVIVCDGVCGNMLIKTFEYATRVSVSILKKSLTKTFLRRLIFPLIARGLKKDMLIVNPDYNNGAWIVGPNGIVIKSHGAASGYAFFRALEIAIETVQGKCLTKIKSELCG